MNKALFLLGIVLTGALAGYSAYHQGWLGHAGNFTGVYSGYIVLGKNGQYYLFAGNVTTNPALGITVIHGLAAVSNAIYYNGVEHKPTYVKFLTTTLTTVVYKGTIEVCYNPVNVGPLTVCHGGVFVDAYVVTIGHT